LHESRFFQNCGTFNTNQNKKYHNFERNEIPATGFLKWTDFSYLFLRKKLYRKKKKKIKFFSGNPKKTWLETSSSSQVKFCFKGFKSSQVQVQPDLELQVKSSLNIFKLFGHSSTDALVISPNRWNFYFPELEIWILAIF
jgi:hypothetical protein